MAYGICDVPQCKEKTYLGWRALTERTGRQVCEFHWNGHKAGTFNLYNAFGFERPPTKKRIVKLKDYCPCGRERKPCHKYCPVCIADRKRQQRKESYHRRKLAGNNTEQPQRNILICRSEYCNNERQPNHTYCDKCAERRRQQSNRERQRRHYKKIRFAVTA